MSPPTRLLCALAAGATALLLAPDAPPGRVPRVPWTNDRLIGSPEPPLPYTVEKTFAKHTWRTPLYVAPEPGTDRLWVIQAVDGGIEKGTQIVRIADDPESAAAELVLERPRQLIYSVAFHPQYQANGFVFTFTNGPRDEPEHQNRITRYTVDRQAPYRIAPESAVVLLEWRSGGHDGGDLAFGRDGFLYISTGDGTSDSDTWNSGQTLDDLLGAVLRIDVDRRDGDRPYAVPADNPFVDHPGARSEIWAYGLRNPWRMSADPTSGQIWVGNNGQDLWETAHLIGRGENYGWSVTEGRHPFYLERKRGPTPIVEPTIEHSHAEFRSLTGGVVYRGAKFPELDGAYIYGDYSSGRIWAMKHDGQKVLWHREIADTSLQLAAFRTDRRGELLIVDHGGALYRLVPAPKVERTVPFPTRLSATGLFASTREHRPAPGVLPYAVNAAGWNDGAEAERFLAIPGAQTVAFDSGRSWTFPDGSALVQTLSREQTPGDPATRRRIETRVLLRQQGEWAGYSYRWDADQADATLVAREGLDLDSPAEGAASAAGPRWRVPSRAECLACHSRAANFVLGASGVQLNRDVDLDGGRVNQLEAFERIGLFTSPLSKPPAELDRIADPRDESADIEARARAYLHVNCAVCHIEAGGGNAAMELGLATPREKMRLVGARPLHDTFVIPDAMLVAPGEPDRSVLLRRLERRGAGQMPPLVSQRVDTAAVAMLRTWIAGLTPARPFVRAWTVEELQPLAEGAAPGTGAERGRRLYAELGCVQCHRRGGEGGTVGPDLSDVGRRLRPLEILQSIVEPSKVVADEYATFVIATEAGAVHTGRIEREDDASVVLRPVPPAEAVRIPKAQIVERRRSAESNMPAGILNTLSREEVADLLDDLRAATEAGSPRR